MMFAEASEAEMLGAEPLPVFGKYEPWVRPTMPTDMLIPGALKSQLKTGIEAGRGIDMRPILQLDPTQQQILLETPAQWAKKVIRGSGVEMTHKAGLSDMQLYYENVAVNAGAERLASRITYLQDAYKGLQRDIQTLQRHEPTEEWEVEAMENIGKQIGKRAELVGKEIDQRMEEQETLRQALIIGEEAVKAKGFKLAPVTTRETVRPERRINYTYEAPNPQWGVTGECRGQYDAYFREHPEHYRSLTAGPCRDFIKPTITKGAHRIIPAKYRTHEGIIQIGDPRQLREGEHVMYSPYLESESVLVKKTKLKDVSDVTPMDEIQFQRGKAVWGSLLAGIEEDKRKAMYAIAAYLLGLWLFSQMQKW